MSNLLVSAGVPTLYEWSKGASHVTLTRESHAFLKYQGSTLEAIANYHWAEFLEAINALAPRIIHKLKRDGIERARSLTRYLRILSAHDAPRECFYCTSRFDDERRVTVDHVIPWSYLADDPLWDLVLACSRCNSAKSDALPEESYITKLIERNIILAKHDLRSHASALITGDEIRRVYDSAVTLNWPGPWSPSGMKTHSPI